MKKIFVFGTLFVLVDLLLVCGTILGVMLYDYFNHRELFKIYQSEYGLPLILFLSFTLSTIICAVLFGVGYIAHTKKAIIKAWLESNSKRYNDGNFSFSNKSLNSINEECFYYSMKN